MPELQDIIEVSAPPTTLSWWEWALIAAAALAFLAILASLLRKSKRSSQRMHTPLARALSQLSALNLEGTDSNRLAVHLSLIVRQYLQQKFQDSALFETDEEFHARATALELLPADASEPLRNYLQDVAQHKYAPQKNSPAALASLVDDARALVQKIDSSSATTPR